MNKEINRGENFELLVKLIKFTQDDIEEIKSKPIEEVCKRLEKEGIDYQRVIDNAEKLIAQIKNREELKKARDKRLELMKRIFSVGSNLSEGVNSKDIPQQQFENILNGSEKEIMAYCRKFQGSNKEDIESLLNDLRLLKELEGETNVGKND